MLHTDNTYQFKIIRIASVFAMKITIGNQTSRPRDSDKDQKSIWLNSEKRTLTSKQSQL